MLPQPLPPPKPWVSGTWSDDPTPEQEGNFPEEGTQTPAKCLPCFSPISSLPKDSLLPLVGEGPSLVLERALDICLGVGTAMCALKLDAKYTAGGRGHRRGRRYQVGFIDLAASCMPWNQQRLLGVRRGGRGW